MFWISNEIQALLYSDSQDTMKNAKTLTILGIAFLIIGVIVGFQLSRASKATSTVVEPITEDQALTTIKELPDVVAYYALFTGPENTSPTTNGKPGIMVEGIKNDKYMLWVFEDIPAKDGKPGYITSFARYSIERLTGKIQKYDVNSGIWNDVN